MSTRSIRFDNMRRTAKFLLFCLAISTNILAQEPFWQQTTGPGGGNIYALAINSSGHIFAGTNERGVFRSTNNGGTWTAVNTGLTNTQVWALAINSSGHIFAGTYGRGVFRSTNNGDSWTVNTDANTQVLALAINSSGHIFAGTNGGGVFRSTNNGDSWTAVNTGLTNTSIRALAINASGHIFAGVPGGFGGGVFRSLDNGDSWTAVNTGLTNTDVQTLAINASGHIFAGTSVSFGSGGVFRSLDNGGSWKAVNTGLTSTIVYELAINTSGHIFAGTSVDFRGGGVFRSLDNGGSWTAVNTGLTNITNATIRVLAINTSGHIFAVPDRGGVFRSLDNGDSWIAVNTGLTNLDVLALAINSTSGYIFAGTNGSGVSRSVQSTLIPTVTTTTATNVSSTSATLNGRVNPNGLSTTVKFQYGLTTNYGSEIAATPSPLTGNSAVLVSASLTGLSSNTLYHYRVVGTNSAGPNIGVDRTFTTTSSGSTPIVTTNVATNVTSTSATLNGTVNPNSLSTTVTFQYGTTTSYGNEINATQNPVNGANAVSVSAVLTGLSPNTLYHYRVVGTNSAGPATGVDQTFTTTSSASVPTVTTNVATNVTSTSATLNATVNPNGLSTTVIFQYGTTTSYGNEINAIQNPISGTNAVSVSAALTGLSPNTLYHYRAIGTNNVGTTNGANQMFTTISAPNRLPVVADIIPNQTLTIGGPSFTRDLNALPVVFTDPDGDALTYTTSSSAMNIATASISGATLTVGPMAAGSATITITANDGKGGMTSTNFLVTVNRPPTVANLIPNQALTVGDASFTRILNASPAIFTDPDGDPLGYTTSSNASSIATASISASTLTVAPVAVGNATITVTANDNRGGTVSTTFTVTVGTAANRSPVVANAISPPTIIVGGAPFTRDLNAAPVVFNDPDGDALTYTASSSVANVATAGIAGSTLTVSAVAAGSATITTMASDGKGGLVSTNFNVSVRANQPPVINHTASVLVQAGRDISIVANITDDIGVASALLWYRKSGDRNFLNVSMSKNGDFFTGIISGADVTSRGVEYYIQTIDVGQISTRLPAGLGIFPIQVIIPEPGVVKSSAQPSGNAQTAYRLISVPLDLDDKNPRTVLEDNLGSYKDSKWRFSELRADQTYAEFPNTAPMNPGKAFWLIVRDPGKTINTGAGESNATAGKFSIPLHPQWNFIGNPFHFTLPLQNLRLKSGRALDINFYDGAWGTPASFQPFEGYAVFNGPPFSVDTLFIDPNLSGSTSNAEGEEILWSIRILAQCQQARDIDNVAAIVATASLSWDEKDRAEPPVIGEYVSVYFPHPEWGKLNQSYRTDSRPEPTSGEVWEFAVTTNIRDKVNLSFEGINSVPPEFEVWLVDEALKISQNLRKENGYAITGSGPEHPKRLKLVVGKRDFMGERLDKIQVIPTTYELSQNFPNPFWSEATSRSAGNSATTIRYGLPREERVTLKIYNLLGEEIATLINDELKAAGYHTAVWDGRNQARQPVAGGVYFYHFQAGTHSAIGKAVLVR